jgi:hypothetical protein
LASNSGAGGGWEYGVMSYPDSQQTREGGILTHSIALLRFCYKTGFTEMKIVQFYALLPRLKHSLDSIICSLRDSIQNSLNWLLTSGSQVRVLHGSSKRTMESTICGRPSLAALLAFTRFCYNSRRSSDALSPR